jgi:hypothetical protein
MNMSAAIASFLARRTGLEARDEDFSRMLKKAVLVVRGLSDSSGLFFYPVSFVQPKSQTNQTD